MGHKKRNKPAKASSEKEGKASKSAEGQSTPERSGADATVRPFELEELEARILLSTFTLQDPSAAIGADVEEQQLSVDEQELTAEEVAGLAGPSDDASPATFDDADALDGASDQAADEIRRELVFIDEGVEDYDQLLNDLVASTDDTREFEVFLLSNARDGIEQISDILNDYQDIDAIHIISHGSEGAAQLGDGWLSGDTLGDYESQLAGWSEALSEEADLLFYGCDLAGGESGEALVGSIAKLTGADVAASDDMTGAAVLGGDWVLEYGTGDLETSLAISATAQQDWQGALANEAPVNTVPGDQSTPQDTDLVFSGGTGNQLVVSDPDAGANELEITLSVDHGTLRLDVPVLTTVGVELQPNTTSTNPQSWPDTAIAPDGSSVTVWVSTNQDGDSYGIYGQRYDADGNKAGGEFLVNTTTTDAQRSPAVAIDDSGNFVVVWESFNQDGVSSRGIYGQRFLADGSQDGVEFRVNTTAAGQQDMADVAMLGSGEFVISWVGDGVGGAGGVFFQRYDASGSEIGSETRINTATASSQDQAAIAMDDAGNFVITWTGTDANFGGVFAQRFDAAGTALGTNFQVNTHTSGYQDAPAIAAAANGDFVIVWTSAGQDGSGDGVYGQLYNADGTTRGVEFLVNSSTSGDQEDPSVAMDGTGFMVAWTADAGGYTDIHAREFDVNGNPETSAFTVNTTPLYYQWYSSVATNGTGGYNVTWSGGAPSDTSGISMQRYGWPVDLEITAGDSGGVSSMTFTGTIADINTALEGMVYTPDAGFNGVDTLTITTDDLGNTGTGGAKSDVDTIAITVGTPSASLWLTTEEDVASSGANGLDSWEGGSVLSFEDPNLAYDPGGTDGTLANVFNLDNFVQDGDSRLDAIHYVGTNMTVGSNAISLQAGDILLSSVYSETLVNSDTSTLAVTSRDVFIFRPDNPSDYSVGGTFIKLIDGADLAVEIEGITLVEQATTVGTGGGATTLNAGDFLFTDRDSDSVIYRLQPDVLGDAATNTGTVSVLVDGTDLGINQKIHGVELVETDVTIGDRTLTSGQLLVSLYADDVVAGTSVSRSDIFILNVTDTGSPTTATVEEFFTGADIGFDTWQESPWAVSLVPSAANVAPDIASNGGGSTASIEVSENTTAVTTVTATDANSDALTYSIDPSSADAARFNIDGVTGVLTFVAAPDFEAPTDADGDNVYEVTVRVSDGNSGLDTQAISVTVTDVSHNLVVTTTANVNDGDTSSAESLNASKGVDNAISLYEAITAANNSAETVTISFNISDPLVGGMHTFTVGAGGLPAISDTVIIDGTTDSDYSGDPVIRIDGSSAGAGINGLTFADGSDGSSVRGVMITGFTGFGIQVDSGADGITIANNWIGTTGTGSTGVGNGNSGINIQGANTIVGGIGASDGNVITNNGNEGINVTGVGATGTIIQGNIIGLDPDGATGSGNDDVGIALLSGANNTTIGGSTPAARNIVSNNFEGIEINSNDNVVQGNYIGTDVTGTLDRGNHSDDGIELQNGATGNLIGGAGANEGNLISGNAGSGITITNADANTILGNFIGTDVTGDIAIANGNAGIRISNSADNVVGGTTALERNVIAGNDAQGVLISGITATGNTIQGNYIGTNATGDAVFGNLYGGIWIGGGASNNLIGGAVAGAGNLISGHGSGVQLLSDANNNTIQGNLIGTDATGTSILGNNTDGISVTGGAHHNTIGGTDAAARNIISGNGSDGIEISGATTSDNVVQGNYIGTDITGALDRGNGDEGVRVDGAVGTLIGGATPAARNVLSGNAGSGVYDYASIGTTILGNYIGVDATGTVALGNSVHGVSLWSTSGAVIGGSGANEGNVIGGNSAQGILLYSGSSHTIQGNYIGTDSSGTLDLGNNQNGIVATFTSMNNLIGGTDVGDGNTIAFNGLDGISISSGSGNSILGNEFYENGGLGVDLAGGVEDGFTVTGNDADDSDTGANQLQNYPVLNSVQTDGATTLKFEGSLTSTPNSSFRIEIFASSSFDPSGFGEAERYLGYLDVTTDITGVGVFDGLMPVSVAQGEFVSATATVITDGGQVGLDDQLAYGSTSEFSAVVMAGNNTAPTTSGIPDITTNENSGFSFMDLKAHFEDAEDPDTDLVYTIVGNTNPAIFNSATIVSGSTFRLDYGEDLYGTSDITIRATDTGGLFVESTFTVTVNSVNDAPVFVGLDGNPTFTEGGAPVRLDLDVDLQDAELDALNGGVGNYSGASLTIVRNGGADPEDSWAFTETNGVSLAGPQIVKNGQVIASFDGGSVPGQLKIVFRDASGEIPTSVDVDNILRQINYVNSSDTPPASVQLDWTFDDGNTADQGSGGALEASGSTTVSITALNDDPVLTLPDGTTSYTEGAYVFVTPSATLTDIDSANLDGGQLVVTIAAGGEALDRLYVNTEGTGVGQVFASGANVSYNYGAGSVVIGTISGGYGAGDPLVITFNSDATPEGVAAVAEQILFWHTSEDPAAISRTVTMQVTDGDGGTSALETRTIDVTPVNDEPVITSDGGGATANINVAENTTAVTTVTATDVDLDTPIYSIDPASDDATFFNIDSGTGVLTFAAPPDFETAADLDGDNVYEVTVQVSDGNGGIDTQALSVTVTDVATNLVVTTVADLDDGDTSSAEALNASKGVDGAVSLNEAITAANNSAETVTISFNISDPLVGGVHTFVIAPGGLPAITSPVIIDATTEPDHSGTPIIELDGSSAGAGVSGLTLGAGSDGSVIRGLVINRFDQSGILVDGSDGNTISGNYIGTDSSGNVQSGSDVQATGITINDSSGNTIGGTGAGDANVLSGNRLRGVLIEGSTSTDNVVSGNFIGTNANGSAALTNVGGGQQIGVYLYDTPGNAIGGIAADAENVISGNSTYGIYAWGANSTGNAIQGNIIGLDASLSTAIGNGNAGGGGIMLSNAPGNLIGGTTADAGNVISGHLGSGLIINAAGGTGNTVLANAIYDNGALGIDLGSDGVTDNDAGDVDAGANDLQNFPLITSAARNGTDLILSGSLDTDGLTTQYRIEFYGNAAGTEDATNGEARIYLGSTTVTTDGSGDATFSSVTLSGVTLSTGDSVTATATRIEDAGQVGISDQLAYGSTSEFAVNALITTYTAPTTSGIPDITVNENSGFGFMDLKAHFEDAEDPDTDLVYTIVGNTNPALFNSATIVSGSTFRLDYGEDLNGTSDITIRATDTSGLFVESTFTVTIDPVNDAPVRTAGIVADLVVVEDSGLNSLGLGSLAYSPGGGTDESSQTLTYEVTVIPDGANFGNIYLADGTTQVTTGFYTLAQIQGMEFAPAADETGGPSFFSFRITDSGGMPNGGADSITETIRLDITPVNDDPIAISDSYVAVEGIPFSSELGLNDLLLNDSDLDSGSLSVNTTPVGGPANGSLVLNADGTFVYTPNNNFNGTDSFVYEVLDGDGGSATATATFTVQPREIRILFTTESDVNNSKVPGVSSWDAGDVLAIGDPNLSFEPAGSDGSVLPYMDLEAFAASADMTINGLHFVSNDVTVGSGANSVDLQRGDLVFVSDANEVMTSNNSLAIQSGDVIVFRPDAVDDYSAGTFIHLLDQPGTAMTTGITLIENDVLVGDVTLSSGSFLFTQVSVAEESSIYHFSADEVGAGTTTGTVSTLISSIDIDVNWNQFVGVMVITEDLYLDGTMVPAGSIVTTLSGGDSFVADNGTFIDSDQIFYLSVNTTTMGSGTTSADATVLFDGGDIGLNNNQKKMRSLTIIEDIHLADNIDPSIALAPAFLNYTEQDPPTLIGAGATVADPDSADFDGGLLRVDFANTGTSSDRLAIQHEGSAAGQVGISGNTVSYGGVVIGTFAGGTDGTVPLTVLFNANADVEAVEAVTQQVTYENVSNNPSTTQRRVEFSLTDGDGGQSATVAKTIVINSVNTAPVITDANDLVAIDEDAFNNGGMLVSDLVAGQITDTDPGALGGIAVVGVDNTNGSWEFSVDGGTTWTAFGSPSTNAATLLAANPDSFVRFVPNPDWSGTVTNGITFHAWDQTSGVNGDVVDLLTSGNLRDQFDNVSYANSDGSTVWTSDWNEFNDNGTAASGNVRVESGKLRLDNLDGGSLESVVRSFDLSDSTTATLTFDYDAFGEGGLDTVAFEVSSDGGSTWVLLESMDIVGNITGSKSYDLEGFTTLTADMQVRFSVVQGLGGTTQHIYFDNVDIAYGGTGIGGSSAVSLETASSSITVNAINDAPVMTSWFDAAWTERKALTIDASLVAGDVVDFPVLVSLSVDPELAAQALANGDDIVFTSGDGSTQLAHEIEYFDEATGELRVWVKTDLSATVDTELFMYYGNASATNQENAVGVWSSDYVGVYHLSESPTGAVGEIVDSSGSGNHATAEGSMTASDSVSTAIGEGFAFDGVDDKLRIPDSTSLDGMNDAATFSLWINWEDAADGDHQIVMTSENRFSGGDGYEWASQGDGDHFFYPDATTPDGNYNLGLNPFQNDQWHHLAVTMDYASQEVKIYVDGDEMTFNYEGVPSQWTELSDSGDLLWGGNPSRASRYFQGMMDEIRMADVVRSQEWLETEFNNQANPDAFITVGSSEMPLSQHALTAIDEDDFTSPGDTVLAIIDSVGGDRITDADDAAVEGIAVVGVDDTNGEWQYDAEADGTWVAFGSVSDSSAVLLDTDARVRFVPNPDYNGSAGILSFRAWDQTSGSNGDSSVDVSTNGNDSAFSTRTGMASLNVNPVEDSPILGNNTLAISEGGTVVLNGSDLSASDAETADGLLEFTITGVNGGQFELVASPGTGITTFTQQQITDGEVQFVHDGGEAAPSYDVTVSDGALVDGPLAATISFTNINDAPIAASDSASVVEGATVTIDLAANDSDPDDGLDLASIVIVGAPSNGSVVVNANGTVDYTHDGSETTADLFTYTISDGSGAVSNNVTVSLTITPQDDNPVLGNNALTISEGGTVVLTGANLSATDAETLDSTLEFTVSGTTGGQFELVSSPGAAITTFTQAQLTAGDVQFVHDGGEGTPSYDVTVSDGALIDGPLAATITFTNVNDAPTAAVDADTVAEGATVTIDLAANDSDPDDGLDLASIVIVGPPTNGSVMVNANGTVDYTHDGSETVSDTFTYTIEDASGVVSNTVTVSLTITPQDDNPVLGNNALTISEGGTVVLSGADLSATDAETAAGLLEFTITGVSGGQFELVASPGTGITNFTQAQLTAGDVQFVHDGGEAAPSYEVTVSDGALIDGPLAATVTFTNVNDAPTAAADTDTVTEGATVTIDLAANDSDPDDGLDLASIVIVGAPSNGSVVVNADGTVDYTHDGSETTADSFTYTISDGSGAVSNTVTVSLTITPQDDNPVLGNNALTISEGGTVVLTGSDLSATDAETAGGLLEFTISGATGGQFELVATPGAAITTFTQQQIADGDVQFVHDGGESAPSYDVTVSDGALLDGPLAATITFTNVNDAPTAVADADSVAEGNTVTIDLAANDSDPDDGLDLASIVIVGPPTNGSVMVNANGTVDYTHDGSETVSDTFTYTIEDASGVVSNTVTVSLTITPQDDNPVLGNNALTISEGGTVVLTGSDLSATDAETAGGLLEFTISGAIGGRFELVASPGVAITTFTQQQIADGDVQFVHDGGEAAPTYDVSVSDGALIDGPLAATITFANVNDAPTAVADADTVAEGATVTIDLAANDSDPDNALDLTSIVIVGAPANGSVVVNADGTVDYTHDGSETTSDAFTYTIEDASGVVSNTTTVSLTVTSQNDNPVLGNNALTISEGGTVVLTGSDLSATDAETAGGLLEFTISGAIGGRFELVASPGVAITTFTQQQIADGDVQFVHDGGEAAPTYDVSVSDGALIDGPLAATISFTNVNDAPTAVADADTVAEGATVTIDLAANDTDPDNALDLTSIVIVGAPTNGSVVVNANGTVDYTHDGSETIVDSFTYTIEDASGTVSNTVTVSLTITPQNDNPVLGNNALTISEGGTVVLTGSDLSATDAETAGGLLEFTISGATGGQFEMVAAPGAEITTFTQQQITAGDVQFVHDGGEAAPTYDVSVSDGALIDGPLAATITFTNVNDAPTAAADADSVAEGATVTIDLAANDSDPDDGLDLASIVIVGAPANGSVVVNADGTVDYTHDGSETISDAFTYTIEDVSGAVSNTVTVSLTITPQNDNPVLGNNALTISEGGTVILTGANLSATDAETADGLLEFTISGVTGGRFEIVSSPGTEITTFTQAQITAGDVQFVHDGGEAAPNYDVTVSDGSRIDGPLSATISFTNVNDAPMLDLDADDSVSIGSGFDSTFVMSTGPVSIVDVDASITDSDDSSLVGLSVTITNLMDVGAEFLQADVTGTSINASYDAGTGVLTLSGTDSVANYEQVLRSISYDNSSIPPDGSTRVIAFVADDGLELSNLADSRVAIVITNIAPTASADSARVAEGGSVVIDLAANDHDYESALDVTSIQVVTGPSNGALAVAADGTVTYTHDGSETTNDVFTYTIRDATGAVSNLATATITIDPVNDAPTAAGEAYSVDEDALLTVSNGSGVLSDESDAEGDALTATLVTGPSNADSFTLNADGSFEYLPVSNFEGTDSFSYVVSDGDAKSGMAVVTLTVLPINDAPTLASNVGTTTTVGTADVITRSELFTVDPDNLGTELSYSLPSAPSFGHLELSSNPGVSINRFTQADIDAGRLVYILDDPTATSDSFSFIASDADGASIGQATFEIHVNGISAGLLPFDDPEVESADDVPEDSPAELAEADEPDVEDETSAGEEQAGDLEVRELIVTTRTEIRFDETVASVASREAEDVVSESERSFGWHRDQPEAKASMQIFGTEMSALDLDQAVAQALDEAHSESDLKLDREDSLMIWVARSERVVMAAGLGLTAALIRGGSLMALTASSVPIWKGLDPVAALLISEDRRTRLADDARFAERIEDETDGVGRVLDDEAK